MHGTENHRNTMVPLTLEGDEIQCMSLLQLFQIFIVIVLHYYDWDRSSKIADENGRQDYAFSIKTGKAIKGN
jgi:hypothetical protein